MWKRPPYLSQPPIELPCCQLLTGMNALRYFGYDTPEPGCPVFEYLVDLAQCRESGARNVKEAWWDLGLLWREFPFDLVTMHWWLARGFPVSISAMCSGGGHMGLVIGGEGNILKVVNWWRGHVVSFVDVTELVMPEDYRTMHVFCPGI